MEFLTYAKFRVPHDLSASFEKVRASIERDDFFKQHLFEFAAFHGLGTLCWGLTHQAGYTSPRPADVTAKFARERAMAPYLKGELSKVIADVDRYGLEHRSMMGMTPLMMAADVGDVPLAETLLERGARIDAVDTGSPHLSVDTHGAVRAS